MYVLHSAFLEHLSVVNVDSAGVGFDAMRACIWRLGLVVSLLGCSSLSGDSRAVTGAAPTGGARSAPMCGGSAQQHRGVPNACDAQRRASDPMALGITQSGECKADADCKDGRNGRCLVSAVAAPRCTYDECLTDADCGEGKNCFCAPGDYVHNRCVEANCHTDADCNEDGACSASYGDCGALHDVQGYYCHTCEDECTDDRDCWGETQQPRDCRYDKKRKLWSCAVTFSCHE